LILLDVNVLVYAHREDAADHKRFREWLAEMVSRAEPYAVSDLVLSGFLRVVTHPRVFRSPTPLPTALQFVEALRGRPNFVALHPGRRHWEIFIDLCRSAGVKGNLVPDAYHAALAIESGSEWITMDRGFARFPRLKWRQPLDSGR
jgi:toxin-antitoxin system PIN domain toxin